MFIVENQRCRPRLIVTVLTSCRLCPGHGYSPQIRKLWRSSSSTDINSDSFYSLVQASNPLLMYNQLISFSFLKCKNGKKKKKRTLCCQISYRFISPLLIHTLFWMCNYIAGSTFLTWDVAHVEKN